MADINFVMCFVSSRVLTYCILDKVCIKENENQKLQKASYFFTDSDGLVFPLFTKDTAQFVWNSNNNSL